MSRAPLKTFVSPPMTTACARNSIRICCLGAVALWSFVTPHMPSAAQPGGENDSVQEVNEFVSAFPAMCRSMVRQSLSNLQLKPIVEAAPNIEPLTCACVEKRMRADEYIGLLYSVPLAAFRAKVDEGSFRPYFMGKVVSFTMACTAIELERATSGFYPKKGQPANPF